MNILLWVLQVLAAVLYVASGSMKVFMFDKVSKDVPSFGALPRGAWMVLGILELVCALGLIVPAVFHWHPALTVVAAAVLAIESLVFVAVHAKYREITPIIMSAALGLLNGVHRLRPDGPDATLLTAPPCGGGKDELRMERMG
jgi:uncharacterized membrane protein YphA (DoxX/SURF4 family)